MKPLPRNVKLIRELIESSGEAEFKVIFLKRTDKSVREMTCKLGVKIGLSDKITKQKPVNQEVNHLITVWSVLDAGYRNLPLEGIFELTINGETYNVATEKLVQIELVDSLDSARL